MNPDCLILKNFELQCGRTLPIADLVYRTYGKLKDDRSNAVLYPTSYGAQHRDLEWLIGEEGILDPRRWFIIIPNMFGNGLSSSPSNTPECKLVEEGFWFTHLDNVRAQEILLREVFGIERLALIYGWSMGAQQAYHWGALYPGRVELIAALCGTARTTDHNRVFLLGLRHALTADPTWTGTEFKGKPERGLKAFAHIYAGWAASQPFYKQGIYKKLGYEDLEDYLNRFWLANYTKRDPHDLLSMIDTWLRCDVSDNPTYKGDHERALRSIRAKTLVMASATDLYFTPADCEAEAAAIPNVTYKEIPSLWGHRAGNPYENPEDENFIRKNIQKLLFQ